MEVSTGAMTKVQLILLILGFIASLSVGADAGDKHGLKVKVTQNTEVVPICDVFEITFYHEGRYENPFFDVTIDLTFTSPGGRKVHVGGFFYGSSEKPRIKVYRKICQGASELRPMSRRGYPNSSGRGLRSGSGSSLWTGFG